MLAPASPASRALRESLKINETTPASYSRRGRSLGHSYGSP